MYVRQIEEIFLQILFYYRTNTLECKFAVQKLAQFM